MTVTRIRRFDIFAIFNKVSKEAELGDKHAKGYGIWMARMIAGKKFGASKPISSNSNYHPGKENEKKNGSKKKGAKVQTWLELSGKPQTDKEYDGELLKRFGGANLIALETLIRKAYKKGLEYNLIRDCEHNHNSGNRFKTGFCQECSNNFRKEFAKILG